VTVETRTRPRSRVVLVGVDGDGEPARRGALQIAKQASVMFREGRARGTRVGVARCNFAPSDGNASAAGRQKRRGRAETRRTGWLAAVCRARRAGGSESERGLARRGDSTIGARDVGVRASLAPPAPPLSSRP